MKLHLNANELRELRRAARAHPRPDVRRHAAWLLALDAGVSVSRLARAVRVSRPTIYRYLRSWLRWRAVEGLRGDVAGRSLGNGT